MARYILHYLTFNLKSDIRLCCRCVICATISNALRLPVCVKLIRLGVNLVRHGVELVRLGTDAHT